MGGRLVLVKSILEGLLVYWISLVHIHFVFLHKLRKRMFNFFCSGNPTKEHFHLASGETIARPKLLGGWGLKNIFHFGKALETKSIWRGLFGKGLWSIYCKGKISQNNVCGGLD